MKSVLEYFIKNSFIVNLVSGFVVIVGLLCLSLMSRDIIPPLQFPMVNVNVALFGGTPAEIEKFVTYPIEDTLQNIVGVKKITSTSSNSSANIRVLFKSDFEEIDKATEEIKSQIDNIRVRLPENIRNIRVQRTEKRDNFLYWLGVENFQQNNEKDRNHYKSFEDSMLKTPGVIKVSSGLKSRDIYVQFDKDKLAYFQLSISDIRRQVYAAMSITPVGVLKKGSDKIEVKLNELVNSLDDIRNLTLRQNYNGNSIRLKDIAKVEYKLENNDEYYTLNGKPAISVGVRKNLSSDAIKLKDAVDKKINKLNESKDLNIKVRPLLDGPHFIKTQIKVLSQNGVLGFILVFIILILFLNFKTALMTSIGLPLAYLGTFAVLYSLGLNIDLLSIIGMILVVGVLVDDAIIVAEKYNDNLMNGLKPNEAALSAVRQLMVPVTGTVLTTLVAFLPLILIKSEMSTILFAVPIIVISSLVISWIESFFILPNHLAHFAKKPSVPRANKFMKKLRAVYEKLLFWTLKLRYVALIVFIGFVSVAAFLGSKKIKKNFRLNISPEFIAIQGSLKSTESADDTVRQLRDLEKELLAYDKGEVSQVLLRVGKIWVDGKMQNSPKFFQFSVFPNKKDSYPNRQIERIRPDFEKIIAKYKEAFDKIEIKKFGQGQDENKKDIITVYVRGNDGVSYNELESELLTVAKDLKTVSEYSPDEEIFQESWSFITDSKKLKLYDLNSTEVARQLRSYFTPDNLIETRIQGENIWVFTEVLGQNNLDYSKVNNITIMSPKKVAVPITYLGSWDNSKVLKKISHKNGQREFAFDFKVSEKSNRTEAHKEFKAAIEPLSSKYPLHNFSLEYLSEEEKSNQAWALKVAMICIMSVYFILAVILKSLTQPLIVCLPIPFGIVGIILSLYFHNEPLGLMALVGLVGTIGVSVNASIILVDQINKLAKIKGKISRSLIILASSSRLRAILLTTTTTLLGVFPMAYSVGGESGFTQPLAFSMAWGLSFSTVLTLFILPSLLEIREDILTAGHFVLRKAGLRKETPKTFNVERSVQIDEVSENTSSEKPLNL